jgi:hypothetical protein
MRNLAGEAFYAAKRYPQALAEFTTGFDLTKRSGFLINIAQTCRKIGKLQGASGLFITGRYPRGRHYRGRRRAIGIGRGLSPHGDSSALGVAGRRQV